MIRKIGILGTVIGLLLLGIRLPLLSSPPQPVEDLEEKLKTLSNKEKIAFLIEFVEKNVRKLPGKSLEYAKQALQLAKESGEPETVARALKVIGNWHLTHDLFTDAMEYYMKALDYAKKVPDKTVIATILFNIGVVYWKQEKPDKALEYHTEALGIRKKAGAPEDHIAASFNNLGMVMHDKGNFSAALGFFRDALKRYVNVGNKRGIAAVMHNLGDLYVTLENYPMALKYFREAIPIYEGIDNQWGIANTTYNVGRVYIRVGEYDRALMSLGTALGWAKKNNDTDLRRRILGALADLYKAQKDFEKALEYHERAVKLKDTLFNKESSQQIARMQIKYDMDKKEKENRLLREANRAGRMVRISLAAVVLMILGLTIVIYNRYRTKKRINELLRISEAKYKAVFARAGDAIFLMENIVFIDCNEKTTEMFGVPCDRIVGKTYADFSPAAQPDGRPSVDAGMERIKKTLAGEPQRFYWKHKKEDGTLFDTMVSLTAVPIGGRDVILAIVHDISDRKQLEDERVKSEKLESIGLLAGGIAHDFNNLLSVLLGNLELAKLEAGFVDRADGENRFAEILAKMEKVVNQAAALSDKFLTFSEGGYPSKKTIAVGNTVHDSVLAALEGTAVKHSILLPGDLWEVECDTEQIGRVMGNITKNAVEAMGEREGGEITVTAANVRLKPDEVPPLKEGRYVSISITDNGRGIPREHLPRIFDPYFTTSREVNRKGLGMGLSIAHSIIKRHNGTIAVSSEIDAGTTFRVYLPV